MADVKHSGKKIKVTQVRSLVGTMQSHRATVRGLGLRRINHTVEVIDTPATRGMINKVSYLLKWES
jgi:large subunit ribosomal protein L30